MALVPSLGLADQIYFNSGRRMEGRVLFEDESQLEVALPNGGSMMIDRADVKKVVKSAPSEIHANFLAGHNSIMVDCTINGVTDATMLVDTGASLCMLSKKLGQELRIDMSDPRYNTQVEIADGSKVPAYYTKLRSLKLQHIVAQDVEAVVLLQDLPENVSFKDGLLGMSFLGRYKTQIDYSAKKFVIES